MQSSLAENEEISHTRKKNGHYKPSYAAVLKKQHKTTTYIQ